MQHLAAASLLGLNVWLCWRLFFIEYLPYFFSVEPMFFGIAKAIRARWPDLGWWGQSGLGYPFEYSYQPLLHHMTALLAALTHWPEARAYHFVVALAYVFGPVTLFYLAKRLTRSTGAAFTAGLLYSLVAPSAILSSRMAADIGGTWFARRLHVAVVYGEGPNISGLTLLPLALLMLHRALERTTVARWAGAAIAMAAVGLTNIPATIALAAGVASYALSLHWKSWPDDWTRIVKIVGIAVTGFLLFAPWLPPSGMMLNSENVHRMNPEGTMTAAKLPYLLALVAVVVLALAVFQRLRVPFQVRFACVFAFLLTSVAMLSIWKQVDLIGQAGRFHVAMELPLVLAFVLVGHALIPWTRPSKTVLTVLLIALSAYVVPQLREFCRAIILKADISQRSEYKISQWMQQNAKGDRVLVTGGTAFTFNYLTDTPQVKGCCDQNLLIPALRYIYPAIIVPPGTGDAATDPSVRWLQVLGVHYVATSGPKSSDIYKDFVHPGKYRGMLRELWRDGDDAIYEVPLASPSLAHAMNRTEILTGDLEHGFDERQLERYRSALMEEGTNAELRWTSTSDAAIQGTLSPGGVYSVQIPFHTGWSATRNGTPIPIEKDGLGFQVLRPACDGPCAVKLHFDGGTERTFLWLLCGLTWTALLIALLR
jgi:hypothetical protein